jgi:hypothetical protein
VRARALVCALWLSSPAGWAHAADDELSLLRSEDAAADEDDDEDMWGRLTEREDKRRPLEPWSIDLAGRPFTFGGEYEIGLGYLRRRFVGGGVEQPDRLLLAQVLELEAFYSLGPPLSFFAQVQGVMEEDLLSHTPDEVSDLFVQRGEMWLYAADVAGTPLDVDLGRLHFEDERRWWWDDDLDAVRVAYETESFEVALALARELASDRSDLGYVDPEQDRIVRWIGEAGWDWRPGHTLELFLLHQDDHSHGEAPGEVVNADREDESDGRLSWLGARSMGAFELRSRGILGYWLDAALVFGEERLVEYEALSPERSEVTGVSHPDVNGWAVDAGVIWSLPMAWEPRLFVGYAFGSGDPEPGAGGDRSFRQTGIEANEAGFGGVERYVHYGVLLAPELSNLGIVTAGAGLSLLRSSSLDLVYHHYRLVEPATSLRETRLEFTLTGQARDVGDELDVVLALEEWERLEFLFTASAFRAGRAFGAEEGTWSYGGFAAMRIAF